MTHAVRGKSSRLIHYVPNFFDFSRTDHPSRRQQFRHRICSFGYRAVPRKFHTYTITRSVLISSNSRLAHCQTMTRTLTKPLVPRTNPSKPRQDNTQFEGRVLDYQTHWHVPKYLAKLGDFVRRSEPQMHLGVKISGVLEFDRYQCPQSCALNP